MKNFAQNFFGALLGIISYFGFVQYYDSQFINWGKLFLNPRSWVVALFVAFSFFLWEKLKRAPESETGNKAKEVMLEQDSQL